MNIPGTDWNKFCLCNINDLFLIGWPEWSSTHSTSTVIFLLCMVRLRWGVDIDHLADMFAISSSTASRIFNTWVTFLANELPPYLLKWPSREQVRMTLPSAFKYFPKTRVLHSASQHAILTEKDVELIQTT